MAPKLVYDAAAVEKQVAGVFGLLVGSVTGEKVSIWRRVPTPESDGALVPAPDWVQRHAGEVRKLMPGGSQVCGVYVCASESELKSFTSALLAATEAVKCGGESLVLIVENGVATFKTVERGKLVNKAAKAQSAAEVAKRIVVEGSCPVDLEVAYDSVVDVGGAADGFDIAIQGARGLHVLAGSESLGKITESSRVSAQFLTTRKIFRVGEGLKTVRLRAAVRVLALVDRDIEAGELAAALREDLVRSLRVRVNMGLAEAAPVIMLRSPVQIPSRVCFHLDGMWWSDYMFSEEVEEDALTRLSTLVGLQTATEHLGETELTKELFPVGRSQKVSGGMRIEVLLTVMALLFLAAIVAYRTLARTVS